MSDVSKEIENLSAGAEYPAEFLRDYVQLECFSHRDGRETFLVKNKETREFAVAKCYEKRSYILSPETELLKTLDNAGIPKAMGFYENDSMLCIVREYVGGVTLSDYLNENRLPQNEIITICLQLADILIYLHTQPRPIIHRDVKPENIVVRDDGYISLIDFDIARTVKKDSDSDTFCFGTKEYASPEQYGFQQTDRRSDIYSFGVLLRFMLTGSTRRDESAAIQPELRHIVDKCTAFDPKDRYDSMKSVKTALENARMAEEKRKRLRLSLAAVFIAAALCAAFVIGRMSGKADSAGAVTEASVVQPVSAEETVTADVITAPAQSGFTEPVIERAVRIQLGLAEDEELSADRLRDVKRLFIFGTDAVQSFEELESFALENTVRGDISTLSDLILLPNLEELFIANQGSIDISAFAGVDSLRLVTMKHLTITDPAPLGEVRTLTGVYLFDSGISDFTALCGCDRLEELDAGKNPISSMEQIGVHSRLRSLSLKFLNMDTLNGIENMPELDTLYLSGASVADVSALGKLPKLRTVYAAGDTFEAVSALFEGGEVQVIRA